MAQRVQLTAAVTENQLGQRLDQILTGLFPDYSRSWIKEWILDQRVLVNSSIDDKPKEKMLGGEHIATDAGVEEETRLQLQDILLNIVCGDSDILAIDKSHDLVVHPGAGNPDGTMLNAPLYYYPPTTDVSRAGIVHCLDKGTTGLAVVTKAIPAQIRLVELLQPREITREYEAVAIGHMTSGGTVEEPISRHPVKRTHIAVHPTGKPAVTHYRIMGRLHIYTRLRLRLGTGCACQIRVHMSHVTHPPVDDRVYDSRLCPPEGVSEEFVTALREFDRQALHVAMLRLYHPITGVKMEWHTLIPQDVVKLIGAMRADFETHKGDIDWL